MNGTSPAALYQEVKAAGLTNNIAFTGHSLGGALASIMAVWFNRPAYVYAPAAFQRSADQQQLRDEISNGQIVARADQIRVLPLVKAELLLKTGVVDAALASYNPIADFLSRENNVQSWAVDGELLRKTLFALNWIEGAPPTLLFTNPGDALGMADKHSITVILLDINMPGMDGYQVLEVLKNYERTKYIPVIAVTANATLRDIALGGTVGLVDYLTKPLNIKKFLATVDHWLAKEAATPSA